MHDLYPGQPAHMLNVLLRVGIHRHEARVHPAQAAHNLRQRHRNHMQEVDLREAGEGVRGGLRGGRLSRSTTPCPERGSSSALQADPGLGTQRSNLTSSPSW